MKGLLLTALTICAIVAAAQSAEMIKFSGTITDPSGAVIVGTDVRVHSNNPLEKSFTEARHPGHTSPNRPNRGVLS